MKEYPKHYAPNPSEWVPHATKMQWQCCDCGLVHNVTFRLKLLEVKMTRNIKETKKDRKEIYGTQQFTVWSIYIGHTKNSYNDGVINLR